MNESNRNRSLSISFLVILLLVILTAILSGCSEYSQAQSGFYAGETVTPEQIAEISRKLAGAEAEALKSAQQAITEESIIIVVPDTDTNGNEIVYWTKDGGVWHVNRGCSSLANSDDIIQGELADALAAGKSRACKKCGGIAETTK